MIEAIISYVLTGFVLLLGVGTIGSIIWDMIRDHREAKLDRLARCLTEDDAPPPFFIGVDSADGQSVAMFVRQHGDTLVVYDVVEGVEREIANACGLTAEMMGRP